MEKPTSDSGILFTMWFTFVLFHILIDFFIFFKKYVTFIEAEYFKFCLPQKYHYTLLLSI